MRRYLSTIFGIICGLALWCTSVNAEITLVEEEVIAVPGLSGEINQFRFYDVDGDGFPEVLASSGDHIVLYSARADSVLWALTIDPVYLQGTYNFRMAIGDLTGDGVADIALAYLYDSDGLPVTYNIHLHDGALGYQVTDSAVTEMQESDWLVYANLLEIGDFECDGDADLLISNRVLDQDDDPMAYKVTADGFTTIYDLFPNSVIYSSRTYIGTVVSMLPPPYPGCWLAATHYYIQRIGHGDDYDYSESVPLVFDSVFASEEIDMAVPSVECHQLSFYSYWRTSAMVLCIGDLDTSSAQLEFLGRVDWFQACDMGLGASSINVGAFIRLYGLGFELEATPGMCLDSGFAVIGEYDDPPELIPAYHHFAYDPAAPGGFYVFIDKLYRYDGATLTAQDSSMDVPDGDLYWEFPYGDDRLRLVTVDSDTIRFFYPDTPTDVDGPADMSKVPSSFELGRPYPNPFNSSVRFELSVRRAGRIEVEAFDLLGRKIESVASDIFSPGVHELSWNPKELASGVYFIRAAGRDGDSSVKVMLLK